MQYNCLNFNIRGHLIIDKKLNINKESAASIMLLLVAIIWGGGFVVTKVAVEAGFAPSFVLAARFLIGFAFMLVVFYKDIKLATKHDIEIGIIAGAMLFIAFLTQTIGVKYTTPSNNAFITSTNVVMVPFISWILMKKRPSLKTIVLSFCCFGGMLILSYIPGTGLLFNYGDMLTFICAFCYSCHIAFLGMTAGRIHSVTVLNCVQLGVAGVISLFYYITFEYSYISTEQLSKGLPGLVFLGIFSTGICFLCQSHAQKILPPARTAIMLSLEGMFGSIISVMLGYDNLTVNLVIGGIVILSSIIALEVDLISILNRKKIQ